MVEKLRSLPTPTRLTNELRGQYTTRIDIAPFATIKDIQQLVGDNLGLEGKFSVVLGYPRNQQHNKPTIAILQTANANEQKNMAGNLKDKYLFGVPCNPIHWYNDESENYNTYHMLGVLEELARDSLVIWAKNDCPPNLHGALAQILMDESNPQTIMTKYMMMKSKCAASIS